MSTLTNLKARAELAVNDYKRERDALYRPDGSKRYGDAEHKEREAALRGALLREVREVQRLVEQAREEAVQQLSAAENASPTALLSTAELERANALRSFAADDVETVGYDGLLARLEAVRNSGDRPEIFAYVVAARKYAKGLTEKIRAGDEAGRGSAVAALQGTIPADLASLLDGMQDDLVPSQKKDQISNLKVRVEEARDVLEVAQSAQSGATNYEDAYVATTYSMPPGAVRVSA